MHISSKKYHKKRKYNSGTTSNDMPIFYPYDVLIHHDLYTIFHVTLQIWPTPDHYRETNVWALSALLYYIIALFNPIFVI